MEANIRAQPCRPSYKIPTSGRGSGRMQHNIPVRAERHGSPFCWLESGQGEATLSRVVRISLILWPFGTQGRGDADDDHPHPHYHHPPIQLDLSGKRDGLHSQSSLYICKRNGDRYVAVIRGPTTSRTFVAHNPHT